MSARYRTFGLIGASLKHSFSKQYFAEKFQKQNISDCRYELFELDNIHQIADLIKREKPAGLNVTIPYKIAVMPFLTQLDMSAQKVGAVNVIKFFENGDIVGYNSDYYGFKNSISGWISKDVNKALVLGTGGASQAVTAVLKDLGITYTMVSRQVGEDALSYDQLNANTAIFKEARLIVNTTPLGMHPNINTRPTINYDLISEGYFLYDLVYNPETTQFMQLGLARKAKVKNGLEMLILQAEKSWEIWNN